MTLIRGAMLALAVLLAAAAFGATTMQSQPSAQRLVVTAVTGLLVPLFWPGAGATPSRTAWRVVGWSVAAAGLAGLVLRVLGGARQPLALLASAGLMLMFVVLVTLALAALIEVRLRGTFDDAHGSRQRERAARTGTLALAIVGALPLWMGPLAELLARGRPWVVDAVVALSPLTHLALASGNDLIRNPWLYAHANLAVLPVSYPDLHGLLVCYGSICGVLAVGTLAANVRRRRPAGRTVDED